MSEERYHYLFSKKSDRHDSCEVRYSEESTWNKSTLRSRWDSNLQRGGCQVLQCNLNSQRTWVTISIGALTNACAVMRAEMLLEVKNKNRTPFRKRQSFAWLNKPNAVETFGVRMRRWEEVRAGDMEPWNGAKVVFWYQALLSNSRALSFPPALSLKRLFLIPDFVDSPGKATLILLSLPSQECSYHSE